MAKFALAPDDVVRVAHDRYRRRNVTFVGTVTEVEVAKVFDFQLVYLLAQPEPDRTGLEVREEGPGEQAIRRHPQLPERHQRRSRWPGHHLPGSDGHAAHAQLRNAE